jgi:CelD/BcsL family acetyltransferase involved in cellulose biosynthesis
MLVGASKRGFHREIAKSCAERGWLRLHGLRLEGALKAILYCFAFKGKGYYYLGGFNPELSKYSLGTVLTGFAIRDAIDSGCDEFDFLRGNEPYKSRWTKESRMNSRLIVRRDGSSSRLAASICGFEQRVEQKVKHELHKRIGAG